MELERKQEELCWLDPVVQQVRSTEMTQEVKLQEGMPDIGRVIGAWGQCLLRSKQWQTDRFCVSAGMTVWVLYAPEDGSQVRTVSSWLPCQLQWDLPEGTPEGQIRVLCLPRFADARSASPRKLQIRCGLSVLAEALVPGKGQLFDPAAEQEDIQLLRCTYPLRIRSGAGEKTVSLDEELTLPASAPVPRKLLCGTLTPRITEHRILNGRLVFRGEGGVQVLCIAEDGQLFSWDFPLPFSQYEALSGSPGPDAWGDFIPAATDLDLSLTDEGHIRVKCGLVVQYALSDIKPVQVVEDAYSPCRELELERTELEVPVILDQTEQILTAGQTIAQEADTVLQSRFIPEIPDVRTLDGEAGIEASGRFQALCRSPEEALQTAAARWEGRLTVPAHDSARVLAVPGWIPPLKTELSGTELSLTAQLPLQLRTETRQSISMVKRILPGALRSRDPDRPSLILRRAGEDSLWQIARESGSTVEAIRQASDIEGEPAPEQMLLIPVL